MVTEPETQSEHELAIYRAGQPLETVRSAIHRFASHSGRVWGGMFVATTPTESLPAKCAGVGLAVHHATPTASDGGLAMELSRSWKPGGVARTVRGWLVLLPSAEPGVYEIVTTEGGAFWTEVAAVLITRLYPEFAQPHFTTRAMQGLLEALRARLGVDPLEYRALEYSFRARLDDARASRQHESDRRWTDRSIADVFQELHELDASLERLRFEAVDGPRRVCSGTISRRGEFVFSGDFRAFASSVLQPCAREASCLHMALSGRERNLENSFEPRPFFIQFDTALLESPEARKRLVRALRRLRSAEPSVIHANPYVHVSLLDYLEDTSCDVFVMSPNRITIVPQTRSSATSLERLYAHICSEFGEGAVVDFAEVYRE